MCGVFFVWRDPTSFWHIMDNCVPHRTDTTTPARGKDTTAKLLKETWPIYNHRSCISYACFLTVPSNFDFFFFSFFVMCAPSWICFSVPEWVLAASGISLCCVLCSTVPGLSMMTSIQRLTCAPYIYISYIAPRSTFEDSTILEMRSFLSPAFVCSIRPYDMMRHCAQLVIFFPLCIHFKHWN